MKRNNLFKLCCIIVACLSTLLVPTFADEAETTVKKEKIKFKRNVEFKIGGSLQWDYDHFDGVHNKGETFSEAQLRRGRLYIKGTLGKNWEGKFQIGVKELEVKDVYIKYKGWDEVELTIGRAKEPFGLETLNSSKYISVIERSMASVILGLGRSDGITLFSQNRHATFAGGFYSDEFVQDTDENDNEKITSYSMTGRVTYTPIMAKGFLIHLGLASSYRNTPGEQYRNKARAEVHQAKKIVNAGSGIIFADKLTIWGVEMATLFGPFSFQTEYIKISVNANPNSSTLDASYDGYYLQADYLLTGESRSYKRGHFSKVTPSSPKGAWQLVGRFSNMDADENQTGVEVENITLGVNYYTKLNIRLSANYIMTYVKGSDANPDEDRGRALSLRFQYVF